GTRSSPASERRSQNSPARADRQCTDGGGPDAARWRVKSMIACSTSASRSVKSRYRAVDAPAAAHSPERRCSSGAAAMSPIIACTCSSSASRSRVRSASTLSILSSFVITDPSNENAALARGVPKLEPIRPYQAKRPWQCLYFLPEPQGQTSLRPTLPQVVGSLGLRSATAVVSSPVDGSTLCASM